MGNPPVATADATITPDLATFLQTGLIMFLGTRSADLTPTSVIASGLRVDGPHRITVFVAEAVGRADVQQPGRQRRDGGDHVQRRRPPVDPDQGSPAGRGTGQRD
jgi:hypothetical protein